MEKTGVAIPIFVVCVIIVGAVGAFAGYKMAPAAAPAELADGSVTTSKLADGAVTLAKLAAEALARMPVLPLASENLANGAVTTSKLAENSVTLAKLASEVVSRLGAPGYGLVSTENIADGAVTSAKIADGSITDTDITSTGITRIADDTVTSAKVADGAIQTVDIAENAATRTYQASSLGDASTTSTSWVDIPEMTVTITTDASPVLITFSGIFATDIVDRRVYIQVNIDGASKDASTRWTWTYKAGEWLTMGTSWLETLSAGSHTISIQWTTNSGVTAYTRHRAMQVIEFKR